ncbi:Chromatin remodeling complex WSTF-ISWI, small subunit [Phaffia rhodozyma]|uniref:Chromatin remodeling complex WSTF-ISWI, small subunit n=1 Tax=Phaffia rhodozyma TaxID=264483 RepID=A0A0F7SSQ8_PHARH|nr:Chromatin remodeling complex WSTF-ISWI, small subunit [Phaffia rhodozyma]
MASTPALSTATTKTTNSPSTPADRGSSLSVSPGRLADKIKQTDDDDEEYEDDGEVEKPTNDLDADQEMEEQQKSSRLGRLNFLLKQSGIYTQILQDKMERQRQDRMKEEARLRASANTATSKAHSESRVEPKHMTRRNAESSVSSKLKKETAKDGAKEKKKPAGNAAGIKRKAAGDELEALEEAVGGKKVTNTNGSKKLKMEPSSASLKNETDPPELAEGQPALVTGAVMRDYQIQGLQWLISLYENGLNGILADEMGLGKTLQTISFIAHLRTKGVWGPFMIVCPLSVLHNWSAEFAKFTPDIPTIQYHGTPEERSVLRKTRLSAPSDAKGAAYAGKLIPGLGVTMPKNASRSQRAKIQACKNVKEEPNTMKTFPVVITSYEVAMKDSAFFRGFQWKYIVVDEGHRLKNMDCKLIRELKSYNTANRLILSGTPLHNNLSELWSLLNFILPDIFDDLDSFQQWFDLDTDIKSRSESKTSLLTSDQSTGIVTTLHSILKPFLLRRLKIDVEKSLPPKKEYLLHAPLTKMQKELYESVAARTIREFLIAVKSGETQGEHVNEDDHGDAADGDGQQTRESEEEPEQEYEANPRKSRRLNRVPKKDYAQIESDNKYFKQLEKERDNGLFQGAPEDTRSAFEIGKEYSNKAARKSVNNMRLQNTMMQLRKVASHPFLFDWPIDPITGSEIVNTDLINASGKMLLLNRLLDALFERKHKVLLFSQFTSMLDIIEDWAIEYKKLKVCRIDGSTPQVRRREQMEEFNKGGEEDGVCRLFLLSTRAGGLGINLVAADTVIFYDQDWNPQSDLQAMDRAHRIGQTRPVLVFRLVTAHTVETKILQKAGAKRRLEALVIAQGKFKGNYSTKEKKQTAHEQAADLLRLEGDNINLVDAGDKIIASPEAFSRSLGWGSKTQSGSGFESNSTESRADSKAKDIKEEEEEEAEEGKKKKQRKESTMFEVFEAARDDVNDGLAKLQEQSDDDQEDV